MVGRINHQVVQKNMENNISQPTHKIQSCHFNLKYCIVICKIKK